jgi:TonB family protein
VAVPCFNYELPPARKDRHVASLVLHIVVIALALKFLPMLPGPQILRPHTSVEVLYEPPLQQQPPAPVVKILPPAPKVLAALTPPKLVAPPEPKIAPPKIEMQPKLNLAAPPVERPKLERRVVTDTFTTPEAPKVVANDKKVEATTFSGSSQPATVNLPAKKVQTGGFGDPNGVRGSSDKKGPLQVAALGGFNLPSGAGNGNGTGGSKGATGTVAGSGFGDVAAGGQSDRNRRGGGSVVPAGFTQQSMAPVAVPRVPENDKSNAKPVEITFKPRPLYTAEARQLHVEGEVLVEVTFAASGQLQVGRVVRGLGHGLDESALRAAQQIRFRPAQRDGTPYDSTALVHIVFELAE